MLAELTVNIMKAGLELRFPGKPEASVRDSLKADKWRWSRFSRCWYRKNSPEARESAARFVDADAPVANPVTHVSADDSPEASISGTIAPEAKPDPKPKVKRKARTAKPHAPANGNHVLERVESDHFRASVDAKGLTAALRKVRRACDSDKSGNLPVLRCVRLESASTGLRLTATNLEIVSESTIGAEVLSPVGTAAVIHAKTLLEAIKSERGRITLERTFGERGEELEIRTNSTHSKTLSAMDPEMFPAIPQPEGPEFRIPANILGATCRTVAPAVADDDSRFSINGAFFHATGGDDLRIIGTDGHRLVRATRTMNDLPDSLEAIVPRAAIVQLGQAWKPTQAGMVSCRVANHRFSFVGPDLTITANLIDGKFPEYPRVIPEKSSTTTTVEADHFLGIVESVKSCLCEKQLVTVELNGALAVTAESESTGKARGIIHADKDGPDVTVDLNHEYLTNYLKTQKGRSVRIALNGALDPVRFDTVADGGTDTTIIMPMALS